MLKASYQSTKISGMSQKRNLPLVNTLKNILDNLSLRLDPEIANFEEAMSKNDANKAIEYFIQIKDAIVPKDEKLANILEVTVIYNFQDNDIVDIYCALFTAGSVMKSLECEPLFPQILDKKLKLRITCKPRNTFKALSTTLHTLTPRTSPPPKTTSPPPSAPPESNILSKESIELLKSLGNQNPSLTGSRRRNKTQPTAPSSPPPLPSLLSPPQQTLPLSTVPRPESVRQNK